MTILNATKNAGPLYAMAGVGSGQSAKVMACSYTLLAALATGDVIQSPMIQAGSVVCDVMLVCGDLDTGTALSLNVGYGVTPAYFISASSVGQAGGVARANAATALPLLLTTNDTIDVVVATGGAGGVGNTLSLVITYLPRNT